jgi:hypothetical protein
MEAQCSKELAAAMPCRSLMVWMVGPFGGMVHGRQAFVWMVWRLGQWPKSVRSSHVDVMWM